MSKQAADARLREIILDPIGTSLRATNPTDDSRPFRDPTKQDVYTLYDARTLDVWESRTGASTRLEEHPLSRKLPARLFEPDTARAYQADILAFRLLVTHPAMDSNQEASHDDLSEPGMRQINHLPFEPEAMQELITRYHLPEHWMYLRMQAREVGNFHRETSWDFTRKEPVAIRLGIVINFPFVLRPARQLHFLTTEASDLKGNPVDYKRKYPGRWRDEYYPHRDDPFIWSFAMSHNLQDGRTRGLLDGLTDDGIRNLRDQVSPPGKQGWYEHPLDLPTILLKIYSRHTQWEMNQLANDVDRFEEAAKREKYKEMNQFDEITTKLAYLERSLDFEKNLTQSLLDTLQYLEDKIFPTALQAGTSSHTNFIHRTNPQVQEKLTNIANMILNNLHTCTYFQTRTKDALEYINALLNLEDAEFSKQSSDYQNMGMKSQLKDAQSNKTISIVTMTFLPATAVAAICSMNVFDWQQPNGVVVSPHFWIFWVVSILLTALVLTVFVVWKRRQDFLERQRDLGRDHEEISRESGESDDDSRITNETKFGPAGRGRASEATEQPSRRKNDEKPPQAYRQEEYEERISPSRRRGRRRSHRRSHTTSRDRRTRPDSDRRGSRLSFRGESTIV